MQSTAYLEAIAAAVTAGARLAHLEGVVVAAFCLRHPLDDTQQWAVAITTDAGTRVIVDHYGAVELAETIAASTGPWHRCGGRTDVAPV